jgi:hypothetical protein
MTLNGSDMRRALAHHARDRRTLATTISIMRKGYVTEEPYLEALLSPLKAKGRTMTLNGRSFGPSGS